MEEKRSDRYTEPIGQENKVSSRVNKNRLLYDEVNSKIGFEEIPTFEANEEINLSSLDMDNLKRSEYQKVKDFKSVIDVEEKKEDVSPKEERKKKEYDINKVLAEAKKNRKVDELEEKRNIKDENVLNNLNKKYLHQKGFTEEDNEELKELIDTITSKTLVDDIKDEEEKELLSELLATTIDIKLESELSQEEIQALADEKVDNTSGELIDTNSFYSKSLELSTEDLVSEEEAVDPEPDNEDTNILGFEEEKHNVAKIIFISLVLLIVVIVVVYFVLQFLGIKFN